METESYFAGCWCILLKTSRVSKVKFNVQFLKDPRSATRWRQRSFPPKVNITFTHSVEPTLRQNDSTNTLRLLNHFFNPKLYFMHKTIIYNSQSVYMEFTQPIDPTDSLNSGQPVCVEFTQAKSLLVGDAVCVITIRFSAAYGQFCLHLQGHPVPFLPTWHHSFQNLDTVVTSLHSQHSINSAAISTPVHKTKLRLSSVSFSTLQHSNNTEISIIISNHRTIEYIQTYIQTYKM